MFHCISSLVYSTSIQWPPLSNTVINSSQQGLKSVALGELKYVSIKKNQFGIEIIDTNLLD